MIVLPRLFIVLEDLEFVVRVAVVLDVDDAQDDAVERICRFEDVRLILKTRIRIDYSAAFQLQLEFITPRLACMIDRKCWLL